MSAPLLEVRDLRVSFVGDDTQIDAVRGASFTLDAGARLGVVGESGCGKSTVALTVLGLLPPHAVVSGQILLDGVDILAGGERTLRPHRWCDIAMVFQGSINAFNPVRTIGEQIAEPLRLHTSMRRETIRGRVADLLEMVGIPSASARRFPHEFSGGMRQRAAMAMALAAEPRVLLADEPTTSLDVIVAGEVLALLRRLGDELGIAVLLISHDLPAVAQFADRIAVMYAGCVVEDAAARDLLDRPRHPYTAALLRAIPDLSSGGAVDVLVGEPPRLDRRIAGCAFAPRCASATEECATTRPEPRNHGGRVVACHHPSPAGAPR